MKMRMAVAALDGMTHVLLLLLYHTCLGLDVTAPPSQTALFKSRVVLPCTFRVTTPPINPQFLAIIWTHGTKDLLRFDNKEKVVSDGVSFDEQAARQGSASLTIHNVTIANHGTYKCLVIYSPDRTSRDIQLNVQATPMVKIHKMGLHKNEKNQVDCSITGFFPTESLKVTWLRNDIEVLGGSKMGTFQPGADGTFRVNSSIILTPGQIQDRPSIICQVEHVSLQKPIQDGFLVTYKVAPIVQLTSLRTADGNEYLYVCKAQGFSPEPLSINWLVDGKMANLSRGREDGLYSKEIYYRIDLKEGNVPEQISCDIEHEALNNPVTKTLGVQRYNECKRNCHLGLTAVLISLLVSSLGAIAYISRKYIRKKKYLKQFQVSHIHKEHVRGNEEKVNLFCMASKCPDVVKVTWMVREHDQRPIIISESQAIKDEESGPLINHEYTVKTDQTEDNGLHNTTTVLSFNPTISSHKNTEIKCELQCGERCEERTLNFSFCYKKPSVKGPIDLSLDDSGNVVCCLTLENFYPRDVQIKWTCGVGNNQKLTSTEDIKNDSDYTSRCNSICTIPWKHFMDPGSKVRVTWTHKSLDQPGYQELSLKDFPWRPVMDNIEVPSLVHGEEAKLRCVIRGYFPDNLEVKWLRREAGKPELYEVPASDKYKIPVLEITKESDNTYTCTASIIVSVLLKTEHKSEFICRVAHPILETTLEKKTGELTVTGIPTVTRKQDDKHLIAEISHFYPKKIKVTWSRTKPKSEPENKFVPYEEKDYTVSELRHESDGTFSLTSSVKKLQDNKLYKLTVTHESMNSPIEKTYKKGTPDTFEGVAEKQEETAQGQMSNPKVAAQGGGIPTVRKQDGKHLIAEISHFYPEKITVTWSRTKQKSGLENKFVPYEEKKYTVSELRPESDGTFSLTSSVKKQDNKLPAKKMFIDNKWYKLKVAKKTNKDNKLYKLTVTHESMKSPIEKTYKEVTTDTFEEVIEKQEVTPKGEMFNSKVAAQGGEDVTEKQEETAQRQMSNFEVAAQGGDTFEDVTEKQEETAQGEMSNSEVAAQGGAITDTFEDVEKKQEETAQGEMSNSAVAAQGGEDVTGKQEETAQGEMSNSAVAAQGGGEEMPATGVMQQRKKNFIKRSFKKN